MTEDQKLKLNAKLLDMAENADWVATIDLKIECAVVQVSGWEVFIHDLKVTEHLRDSVKEALIAARRRTYARERREKERDKEKVIEAFLADDA